MEVLRVYFPVTGTAIESGEAKRNKKMRQVWKIQTFLVGLVAFSFTHLYICNFQLIKSSITKTTPTSLCTSLDQIDGWLWILVLDYESRFAGMGLSDLSNTLKWYFIFYSRKFKDYCFSWIFYPVFGKNQSFRIIFTFSTNNTKKIKSCRL